MTVDVLNQDHGRITKHGTVQPSIIDFLENYWPLEFNFAPNTVSAVEKRGQVFLLDDGDRELLKLQEEILVRTSCSQRQLFVDKVVKQRATNA